MTILIYIIVAQKHHMLATYPCSMKKSAQPTTSSLKLSGREEGPRVDSLGAQFFEYTRLIHWVTSFFTDLYATHKELRKELLV